MLDLRKLLWSAIDLCKQVGRSISSHNRKFLFMCKSNAYPVCLLGGPPWGFRFATTNDGTIIVTQVIKIINLILIFVDDKEIPQ